MEHCSNIAPGFVHRDMHTPFGGWSGSVVSADDSIVEVYNDKLFFGELPEATSGGRDQHVISIEACTDITVGRSDQAGAVGSVSDLHQLAAEPPFV